MYNNNIKEVQIIYRYDSKFIQRIPTERPKIFVHETPLHPGFFGAMAKDETQHCACIGSNLLLCSYLAQRTTARVHGPSTPTIELFCDFFQ
jgi:hypothetical protein